MTPQPPAAKGPKKALLLGAFFCVLSGRQAPVVAACPPDRIDTQVQVRQVFDGDTLELADGRRLRIIGVNTPELGRDGRAAEPYSQRAAERLRQLLDGAGGRIALRFDVEREDRYGRLLAHPYLADGRSIAAELLGEGLAAAIVVPPNAYALRCLGQAERDAREARRGLWSLPRYAGESSDRLSPPLEGFRVVRGRIERVGESRRAFWFNLPGGFAVQLRKTDMVHFGDFSPRAMLGREIEVRGWVRRARSELRMQLRHPAMLRLLN